MKPKIEEQKLPPIKNSENTISRYLNWLNLQDYKNQTIKNKYYILATFFKFLDFKPIEEIEQIDVEMFMGFLKKSYKQNTIHKYNIELQFFFHWYKPKNDFFFNIKTRCQKNRLPTDEILTPEEVMKIIQSTRSQKARAFIFLLWDSAGRLDEVLSMKKKSVQFDQWGGTVTVMGGKTGDRKIRIVDSLPDLQLWLSQHPGNQEDYLFPIFPNMTKTSRNEARNIVNRAVQISGIQKHVYPHLFRHSKLTDLCKHGMNEMVLRIFAGWGMDSQMPSVYLHLSGGDVDEKILLMKGIKKEECIKEVNTDTKICPRCSTKNPFDAVYCRMCSMILDQTKAQNPMEDKIKELEAKIKQIEKNNGEGDLSIYF